MIVGTGVHVLRHSHRCIRHCRYQLHSTSAYSKIANNTDRRQPSSVYHDCCAEHIAYFGSYAYQFMFRGADHRCKYPLS